MEKLLHSLPEIESRLDYKFQERSFLILAFIHRSFVNEHREITQHNERLEFLGDSVLGLLVSEYLYKYLPPSTSEGDLSYLRSRLVEASSCVSYIQKFDLEKYILLGKGERMNDGRGRESILADLFEAVIGAIYLDADIEAVRKFIFKHFTKEMESILKTPLQNWKALLQDYCQRKYQQTPIYKVLEERGPDHCKTFKISVQLNRQELGRGSGSSKKEAQQAAAANAISQMNISYSGKKDERP